jgi:hypothetical protein
MPRSRPFPPATVPVVLSLAVGAYAWWVTSLPGFSASTTAAVLGAGVVAVAAGLARRRPRPPAPRRTGRAGWAVLVAALAGWQLAAYLQHPRSQHPTISSLTNTLLESHTSRAFAFVAWIAAAAALARR